MTYICASKRQLTQNMTPSHYLHPCWINVNHTLGGKFQWNLNQTKTIFFKKLHFVYIVVCKMTAILSRLRYVNGVHSWTKVYSCFFSELLNQLEVKGFDNSLIKSPRYIGGDFMFLYRFVRRRRPLILVHAITFEQLFGFLSFLARLLALTCRLPD